MALPPDEMARAQQSLLDDVNLFQPVERGPFHRYEDALLISLYLISFDIMYAGDTALLRE